MKEFGLEEKDYEKANLYMCKAQAIIRELRGTLDMKYDISKNVVSIKDVVLFSLKDKSKKRFSKEDTKDGFRLK